MEIKTESSTVTIQAGRVGETAYCRKCGFSVGGTGIRALELAKSHAARKGHTVDVYYETLRTVRRSR